MKINNAGATWSEAELDAALAELNSAHRADAAALNSLRAKLFAAEHLVAEHTQAEHFGPERLVAESPPPAGSDSHRQRRLRARWISAGSIVAAAILVFFIPNLSMSNPDRGSATAAASDALNRAASFAVTTVDEPAAPGQYRLIQTHAWYMTIVNELPTVAMFESTYDVWAPADMWSADSKWLLNRTRSGNRIWLVGNEDQAKANGYLESALTDTGTENQTIWAPCGDFYGQDGCNRAGNWADPTATFLSSLPRDPSALFNRMAQDIHTDKGRTLGPEVFEIVREALRSGLYPADLRAALFQALTFVDGLEITSDSANVDGRAGIGFALNGDDPTRHELIIDPTTGAFIGEREVTLDGSYGIPVGTTVGFTAVLTAVVDDAGELPPN